MDEMGFVIAFPGSASRRRTATETKRPATAQIMIFPGVRYERPALPARPRDTDKPGHRFFDPTPQPG